jgi:Uma2 family endonuclease
MLRKPARPRLTRGERTHGRGHGAIGRGLRTDAAAPRPAPASAPIAASSSLGRTEPWPLRPGLSILTSVSGSSRPADPHHDLPPVDVRLVAPESRYEIHDGRLEYVAPADEPHGSRHSKISALLEAYARDEFDVASDMLTRTSETSDIAPDASVFPSARDEATGGRQLEQLAFEVVSTERLSHAADKARRLAERGVRRVFAVDVSRKRAFEWSRDLGTWEILSPKAVIEDSTLAAPLPVQALVDAAKADDAMAAALLAKHNPVIESALAKKRDDGRSEGKLEGKIETLLRILERRGIEVSSDARARITETRDPSRLDAWLDRAITCHHAAELFE